MDVDFKLWYSDITVDMLYDALEWDDRAGNRQECYMDNSGRLYTYGRPPHERTYEPIPFPHIVQNMMDFINEKYVTQFDVCVANYYEDERNNLGWHSDDSPEVDPNHPIIVASFGAEREIWTRPIVSPKEITKYPLVSHSLFIMSAGKQQTHQHKIPKVGHKVEPRLSLTFRKYI
jgi:alkylated DNA repair dioxygenase AlkB